MFRKTAFCPLSSRGRASFLSLPTDGQGGHGCAFAHGKKWGAAFLLAFASFSASVAADTLPAVDIDRIVRQMQQLPQSLTLPTLLEPAVPVKSLPTAHAPTGSQGVVLQLSRVVVDGMTVFTDQQVQDIFAPYIGHEITLDTLWVLAGQLTKRYHDAGYFLSRATVPQQEIKDGTATLRVVEGAINEIVFDDDLSKNFVVSEYLDQLRTARPLTTAKIESVLLSLNDLYGVQLRAVLDPVEGSGADVNGVRLVLLRQDEARYSAVTTFDNQGSRFLGPFEFTQQAQASFWPTHRTTATYMTALPFKTLQFGGLKHEMFVTPGGKVELYGYYTAARPGDSLKPYEIRGHSTYLGTAFDYSLIRQRTENLNVRVAFETRDSFNDILGTPLTRDYIRAARLGVTYQIADFWNGQNTIGAILSQGLDIAGASQKADPNISRSGARADFTKLEMNAARVQPVGNEWQVVLAAAGQYSAHPLYSSEQFSYGGSVFGRAYDNAELTGDRGAAALAELQYAGIPEWQNMRFVPYGYYDIGAVWNVGNSTEPYGTGSSAGFGVRLSSILGISSGLGVAFPLTKAISNPLDGNGKNPRYQFSLTFKF